jgi:hypothetical protein
MLYPITPRAWDWLFRDYAIPYTVKARTNDCQRTEIRGEIFAALAIASTGP